MHYVAPSIFALLGVCLIVVICLSYREGMRILREEQRKQFDRENGSFDEQDQIK